jgi:NTF2 fold immunity protein
MPLFLVALIYIKSFQINPKNALIKDKQTLIKYAEPILFKRYGKEQIIEERPYIIHIKNEVWIMDGTLPAQYTKGGTFHIEIDSKEGKVIKIIHYR